MGFPLSTQTSPRATLTLPCTYPEVMVARFPDTPGEAIHKYWDNSDPGELGGKQDLNVITLLVDDTENPSFRFDVGDNVNLLAPPRPLSHFQGFLRELYAYKGEGGYKGQRPPALFASS